MLLGKDGSRDEKSTLLAVHDALERSTQRNLRLSIADIAAEQPIHYSIGLHILLDLFDRRKLIRSFVERKAELKPALPIGIR